MQSTGISPTVSRTMIKSILVLTIASIVVSLVVTGFIMWMAGRTEALPLALSIAGLCPLAVTPVGTYVIFRQTLKLEAAHNSLTEAHHSLFEVHARLKAAHMDLEHRVSHDSMTGLANRDAFLERLSEAKRLSGQGFLLMIDADRFKQINDDYGHDAGDRALVAVADAISRSIRATDFGARIGGEEFAVILCGAGREDAGIIAERVRVNVENTSFITAEGKQLSVTVSIGGASFGPQSRSKEIMRVADSQLYEAKRSGRNLVCIGNEDTRAA